MTGAEESAEDKQTEKCDRCGGGEVSARVTVQADYDDAMQATYRVCNDCVGSLGEWYDSSAGDLHVEREDIAVVVKDGEPAIKVGDALIQLETRFEGAPPEHVEKDHYDGPFFLLDFDEEYFDGYLEITPAYEEVSE